MTCWHKWDKWSHPVNGVYGRRNETGWLQVCQMRVCQKCGKAEVRELPQVRSLDSLRSEK